MAEDSPLRTQRWLGGAAVLGLAALTYLNVLGNGLVWDDPIVLERQLHAFRTLGDVFFPPAHIPQFSPDYYRPLTTLSYLVDRAVGGTGPFTFHLSVMLYHLVATLLVYRLGLALFAATSAGLAGAIVGAALFGVHPIHSESVAWGAGRSDVIATVFAVGAMIVYLHPRWSLLRRALMASGLIFLGMLAKETAGAVLLLLPFSDWVLSRQAPLQATPVARAERRRQRQQPVRSSRSFAHYAPFAVVLIVYLVLRQAALGLMVGEAQPLNASALVEVVAAGGFYLSKLVVPLWQSAYVSDLPAHPLQLAAAAVALIGLAAALGVSFQKGQRIVSFALVWMALALAPSLSIVLKIPSAPVAERYLYLPSVGFCLLIGAAVMHLVSRQRTAVWVASALLLASAAYLTAKRNTVWRTNLSLWEDTAVKNTTDGLPLRGLATAELDRGNVARADELFRLALKRRNSVSGQYVIYNNLGSLAMQRGNLAEAERSFRTALSLNPQPEVAYNLGLIALTRALETDPPHDDEWKRQNAQQARRWFEQAAQQSPHDADIQIALGQTFSALGDRDAARQHLQQALTLGASPSMQASVRKLLEDLQ